MPLLAGIPISEEQCIGDSLDTINNAFLSLSSNLELSSTNLLTLIRQTSGNLYTLIQNTSGQRIKYFQNSSTTFYLSAEHANNVIFLDSDVPVDVVRSAQLSGENHEYGKGQKTTFVQTGSGTVTFVGFNAYQFKYSMAGQFTQASVFYAGSAIEPTNKGWIVTGDLVPVAQPLLSLQAAPIPGAEDTNNQLSLTGDLRDTIYYFPDPYGNVSYTSMYVYVNDVWRTTCDFTEERLGTEFGYRLINLEPNTTGPQISGIFANGRVDIEVPGYSTQSTYYTLSSINGIGNYGDPGNEDPDNDISFTANSSSFDGDTIFYLADPDPAGGGGGQANTKISVSTNGGATYTLRGVVTHEVDRIGQSFGFRRAGTTGGPEIMGEFTNGDPGVLFILPNDFRPTATPRTTNLPTATPAKTPHPTRTPTPTPTPAPTGAAQRVSLVADVTPGTEDIIHSISFVAENASYKDTISYFPRVIEDFVMEFPMIIYVNGIRRTAVTFPNDFTGEQFGYKLAGAGTSEIQAYGTFAPGRVDLTIDGQFSLVSTTTPGTENADYGISIVSESSSYNGDTFYFYGMELQDYVVEFPMSIFVNGVRRAAVTFPDDFTGKQFGYRLAGTTGAAGPRLYGTFAPGNVYLTAQTIPPTPTVTVGPTPTPTATLALTKLTARATKTGTYDDVAKVTFTSVSAIYNDLITYTSDPITNYTPLTMTIRLSGVKRTTISFPTSRLGKTFSYKLNPVLDDTDPGNAILTFATGLSDLSASAGWTWTPYASSLSAIASPGGVDDNNLIAITRTNVSYNNDRIYYHPDNDPESFTPANYPMLVYYNGVHRATVDFPEERYGTAFGYSRSPAIQPEFYGVFGSGAVAVSAL